MKPVTRTEFWRFVFGDIEGYFPIASIDRSKGKKLHTEWFNYPEDLQLIESYIDKNHTKVDLYFCPHLFTRERRKKEYVAEAPVAWSDGDECPIEDLILQPSVVIRTSEGRHSFLWKFDELQPPDVGEDISKRIAYYHADAGMDKSGWDLTQLLRVPGTYNHKYSPPQQISKAVIDTEAVYRVQDFSDYPEVEKATKQPKLTEIELPEESAKDILDKYKHQLSPRAFDLFAVVPTGDWSGKLWELELTCLEAGMSSEEAFVVVRDSACNKYRRDQRPDGFLWKEVQRAAIHVEERRSLPPEIEDGTPHVSLDPPKLLTDDEREHVQQDKTFIEQYTDWAKTLGDAAEQYHPVGAFVILSSLLSGVISLPTSFGVVKPNLWFMILADTTLTRKSTAMDNATDLLMDVDDEALLATDGSIEGLLTAMGTRPNKPSLFLRDEVTGLIDAITNKSYLSGMMETLTKLYDGKNMKRILRSETIDVRDPIFIMFTGGIRGKMMELLNYEHVSSGFLPRFVFVTADADITKLKPIGPPTSKDLSERNQLLLYLRKMHDHYAIRKPSADGTKVTLPKQWIAELSDEAWLLYNKYEVQLLDFALSSHDPTLLTPMVDRLAKSGLKAAVLIAASRIQEDTVKVTVDDVLHAFYYVEKWLKHTAYIIMNIGTSQDERRLQSVLAYIESNPGTLRSKVMQRFYLSARDADQVFATLEQRHAIRRDKKGASGERLHPVK